MEISESSKLIISIFGSNFFLIIAVIGYTVSTNNSIREDIRSNALEIRAEVREMKEEMKDFHGRLISLEERFRSKE